MNITPFISIPEIVTKHLGKSLNNIIASPYHHFKNYALEIFCPFFYGEGFRHITEIHYSTLLRYKQLYMVFTPYIVQDPVL